MPKTRTEKEAKVAELSRQLGGTPGLYLADLSGMSVELLTDFRRKLRENGIRLEVVKNTLLHRAAVNTPFEKLDPYLEGPTAMLTVKDDVIAPARVLSKFLKENKFPRIKAACFEGEVYDEKGVEALAKLPSREVLLSQFLSVLQAPLTQLAVVLKGTARNLANVMDQVAKQKEGAA